MNEIFGGLFSIFQNVYGIPLANFLFEDGRVYSQLGIAIIVVSVVVAAAYYYIIDHPALCSWKGWGMFGIIDAFICFLVAWLRVLSIYNSGEMMETNLTTGEAVPIDVSTFDLVCFGVTAAVIAVLAYVVVSFVIKWRSVNCSHYPHIKK